MTKQISNEQLLERTSQKATSLQIKKKSMTMDWTHMEKAQKQHHQRGTKLEPTRPDKTS